MRKIITLLLIGFVSVGVWGQTNKIESTGNVGIGTTSPTETLDVDGDMKLSGNLNMGFLITMKAKNYAPYIEFNNAASPFNPATIYGGASASKNEIVLRSFNSSGYKDLIWNNKGSFSINAGWNTTEALEVGGNMLTKGILMFNDNNTQILEGWANTIKVKNNFGQLEIGPGNTDWCHFKTDRTKFWFEKSVYINGALSGYGNADFLIQRNGSTKLTIGNGTTTNHQTFYNKSNICIAPGNGLGYRFWNSDSYKIYMSQHADGSWGGRLDNSSDYNMYFKMSGGTNRGWYFKNTTTGKGVHIVGNGDIIAQGNITSKGKITAEEILVEAQGNTADFVFEPNYKLRDLSEVENYILTNKHLPDIPSATQMEAQGVNLAEMNKLLLQKVEELTLYTISQEEKLNQKSERIEKLEEARRKEQVEREKMEKRLEKIEALLSN